MHSQLESLFTLFFPFTCMCHGSICEAYNVLSPTPNFEGRVDIPFEIGTRGKKH